MIKRVVVTKDYKLSSESRARLKALRKREVDTSDIPQATKEQLKELRRQLDEKRRREGKRMFSLRLTADTIKWWQSMGEGYTSLMSKFLDAAKYHPEWVQAVL